MAWLNSAEACRKLKINQRQLKRKRIDGSITYKKQRNGRYMYDVVDWSMVTDYLVPFMEPFIVIPDKPLLEELISLDVRQLKYLLIGQFQGIPVVTIDESFLLSHINTLLLYMYYGCHRFGYTNSVSIAFICTCIWYLRTGIDLTTLCHITACSMFTSILSTSITVIGLPVVLVWICGSCYTFFCLLFMLLEHKTGSLDHTRLMLCCVMYAGLMNVNIIM
jgi:hypothetical protein